MSIRDLKAQARGRWTSILRTLDVPTKMLNKKNQPCPNQGCGGKDRWRYTNREDKGEAFCSHCGNMSPLDILMAVRGWDLMTAVREVEGVLGIARYQPERTMDRQERAKMLNELWQGGSPIKAGDPAALFLAARCGVTVFPSVLRSHNDLFYKGEKETGIPDSRHPGMLAMVQDHTGGNQTIHRTFLTADGDKAPVPSARRIMPGGFEPGSAVRLTPIAGTLGVAEGIETALAAKALTGVPTWSLLNAHNLSQFRPPDGVRKVVVFADNDPGFAGQAAAYALAKRLVARQMAVEVRIPDGVSMDWRDVWEAEQAMLEFNVLRMR